MRRAVCGLVVVAFVVVACNSEDATPTSQPTPETLPSRSELDPVFDVGDRVEITKSGFRPELLVALVERDITWTNTTNEPQSVEFDNTDVSSGAIPPGGTWVYRPDASVSITYHNGHRPSMKGALQIEPAEIPGQD